MELNISGINKKYGKQYALKDFSITFTDGVYGLLGPNGAGKTTLINIILGILKPDSGCIQLNGEDVKKLGANYYDLVGYLPQYPEFYGNFTCQEFLEYMCALKGIDKKKARKRIELLLHLVNLTGTEKKKIRCLSGGMRQRLGIAQALVNDPQILVLDEPTAGLDPKERIRFRNIISKLSRNRIVILATHIVSDVEYIAKEIAVMDRGSLVQKGTLSQLEISVQNKVWEIEADEELTSILIGNFSVGNIIPIEDGYRLKVISEEKPGETARHIPPTLEDVFLSYFGR